MQLSRCLFSCLFSGLGLGLPGLKPGLADKMQLTKAMTESDHCADKMELDRALKESAAEFTGAHEDELQRVLKESSMDYVSRVLHRCRVSTSTLLAYHCVDTVYLHFKRTDVRPEKVNGALGLRRNQFRAGTESAGQLVGVVPS